MQPIYCKICEECGVKTEIFFSPSVKSETGKLIPIEVETKKNHDCPNREKWRQLESSKWSKPSKQEGQTTKFEEEVIRLLKENNKIQKENNQIMKALTVLYVRYTFSGNLQNRR